MTEPLPPASIYGSPSAAPPAVTEFAPGVAVGNRCVPRWWRGLLLLTVACAAAYMLYHPPGLSGRGLVDAYNEALAESLRAQFAEIGMLEPDRGTILKYMNDPQWLKVGEMVFQGNCVACHGPSALGLVGPNLRDDAWIHVTKLEDIAAVVANGAKTGAMPAWGKRLHPNEIVLVAAYVASLRSTPGSEAGKAPEREAKVIPPWLAE